MNWYIIILFFVLISGSLNAQNALSKAVLFHKKEYFSLQEIVHNQDHVYRLNLSSMRNVHDRIAEGKTGSGSHIESIPYQLFPSEILECYNLHLLHINYHELTEIPVEINRLDKLQFLDLGYNQLSSLPQTFSRLSDLEVLNLENNLFSEIPPVLYQLPKLRVLNISGNVISEQEKQILKQKNPRLTLIDR